jgi:hypothetical protein
LGYKKGLKGNLMDKDILATIIQRKWKRYILEKKIWCMLKPDEPMSIKVRNMELEKINCSLKKINEESTRFKTMIVNYHNNVFDNKNIEVVYKGNNRYNIYDEDYEKTVVLNNEQVINKLNKINNIISIKIQAITTELNFYGYPEILEVKIY